jgi:SAM-dependent methyltransferase
MASVEATVQAHYGRPHLLQRIEAALKEAGVDPQRPKREDLYPFDQLHGFGFLATEAHAARAKIRAQMRVLDLGCGLGGASRYLAASRQAKVTAVDLTPEFVEIARELTRRCGVDGIEYRQANALALPFADGSFDHVWCHNVTMNIKDKAGLAKEVVRVLRAGGTFSCVETEQGPAGAPRFPLPWASEPQSSYLVTPEAMQAAIESAGLKLVERREFGPDLARRGPPPRQANAIVMGDDFKVRLDNAMAGLRERRLVDAFILASKE